jgi:glycosyltransferase involved in cell wall biosynthesis
MLRALKQAGVSTRVLCLTRGEPFEQEILDLGVPVEWVGGSGLRPLRLYRIIQSLRREPADILQSVHYYTNLYVAVAGRLLGIREIGAIRSDLLGEIKANGIYGRWQLRLPRHLIANSELARQRAIETGIPSDRIGFVRNAVNIRESNGKKSEGDGRAVQVLFAGRLTEVKRPDRFLRVISKVVKRLPDQRLKIKIAGDGPLRADVTALARSLGLGEDGFEMLGELEDMSRVYQETDLLMLTSDQEGTPNVLLEAMSFGIPVAATRVGGVPEIIGDQRGFLSDPEDEEALTAAAVRLITDVRLRTRFGRMGQDFVARRHSLAALQAQLTGFYSKILSR